MPKYTCKRCLKEFSQKSHFDKHLKRKRPCQNNKEKLELIVEEKVEKILENKFNISENKLNETENEIINNKELNNMAEESKEGENTVIVENNSLSNRYALKDKIHEIHNYLRNHGAGYGMNALKVFNIFYGLKKIEEYNLIIHSY